MKYRKKPVVIEAVQYDGLQSIIHMRDVWPGFEHKSEYLAPFTGLKIRTLEGDHMANRGDYIIKGVKGEFYPCKADIFELTYEPESDSAKGEE